MRDFLEYRRSAVAEGERGAVREYVIVPGHDPSRARALARDARDAGDRGAARRRGDQGGLADHSTPAPTSPRTRSRPDACCSNLLDPHTAQDEAFVKEQDRRRETAARRRDLRHHRVEPAARLRRRGHRRRARSASRRRPSRRPGRTLRSAARRQRRRLPPARVGYLLPWGSATAARRRRSAARRHPRAARRAAVHAGRPQVSDRHGDRPRLGQRHATSPPGSGRSWRGTKSKPSPSTAAIRTRASRSAARASWR